jgi:hypothetical protein
VKKAQVFPSLYEPEVYQHGANNIMRGLKKVRDLGWGVFGAGAGLVKSIADRKWMIPIAPMSPMSPKITIGEDRPEGSWGDYLRAGWNVGRDNADLMTASMIEGAANSIPFVKFKAPSRYANRIHKMKIDNGMNPEDASSMRVMAGSAGSMAASMPLLSVAGRAFGAAGKAIAPALKANPKILGPVAENLGQSLIYDGEQIIESHEAAKRTEAKKRYLEKWQRDRLNSLKELADAPGPYTDDERMKRRNSYLVELENANPGVSQSL